MCKEGGDVDVCWMYVDFVVMQVDGIEVDQVGVVGQVEYYGECDLYVVELVECLVDGVVVVFIEFVGQVMQGQ